MCNKKTNNNSVSVFEILELLNEAESDVCVNGLFEMLEINIFSDESGNVIHSGYDQKDPCREEEVLIFDSVDELHDWLIRIVNSGGLDEN